MSSGLLVVNLGGEGEIPGVINQLRTWVLTPGWTTSQTRETLPQLAAAGHVFLICPNLPLPFPDNSVDLAYTNSVPIDRNTHLGPGVQSSEIRRILKPGGRRVHDGGPANGGQEWTKP
jgi:SAM-dependent methyltransferase